MKTLILAILLTSGVYAHAGNDGGGGNSVGSELFDFYENRGTTKFIVEESTAYKTILVPIFNDLNSKIPGLSDVLKKGLGTSWLMEPKSLNSSACKNSSMISVSKKIVGCQNKFEIRLSKSWYDSANLVNQAGLIMHELIRYQSLHNFKQEITGELSDESINFVNRLLMNSVKLSQETLQEQLHKAGFGLYATATNYTSVKNHAKNKCQTENVDTKWSLLKMARDGRWSLGERKAALALALNINNAATQKINNDCNFILSLEGN